MKAEILSSFHIIVTEVEALPEKYWRIILGIGILITVISLISLPTLYEDISGDSVPNVSQKGPPIEYQWDVAVSRIVIAGVSLALSIYSYNQIRTT